jgi:hypothetical protein
MLSPFGCKDENKSAREYIYCPFVDIEYVDVDGNNLFKLLSIDSRKGIDSKVLLEGLANVIPEEQDWDAVIERNNKLLYSGDLISLFEGSSIRLIIPVPEAELLNK